MTIQKHIPNFLTLCNLICGCVGVVYCLEDRSTPIAYFVWAAAIFDFFDGFSARLLRVCSPIGKELDSLADVVSFGLLPAMVMYKMLMVTAQTAWIPFISFLIAVCAALRLAIFNVDESQTTSFKGLNTPSNALFITSLPLLAEPLSVWLHQSWLLILITLVFSWLMVSPIRFFALKFNTFSWSENKLCFIFILLSIFLISIFQVQAIPLIILSYILISLTSRNLSVKKE